MWDRLSMLSPGFQPYIYSHSLYPLCLSRYFHISGEMVNGKSVQDPFLTCRSCSTLYWWFSLTKQIAIKPPSACSRYRAGLHQEMELSCQYFHSSVFVRPGGIKRGVKRYWWGGKNRRGSCWLVSWWSALLLRSREQSVRLVIITRLYLSHCHPATI